MTRLADDLAAALWLATASPDARRLRLAHAICEADRRLLDMDPRSPNRRVLLDTLAGMDREGFSVEWAKAMAGGAAESPAVDSLGRG